MPPKGFAGFCHMDRNDVARVQCPNGGTCPRWRAHPAPALQGLVRPILGVGSGLAGQKQRGRAAAYWFGAGVGGVSWQAKWSLEPSLFQARLPNRAQVMHCRAGQRCFPRGNVHHAASLAAPNRLHAGMCPVEVVTLARIPLLGTIDRGQAPVKPCDLRARKHSAALKVRRRGMLRALHARRSPVVRRQAVRCTAERRPKRRACHKPAPWPLAPSPAHASCPNGLKQCISAG